MILHSTTDTTIAPETAREWVVTHILLATGRTPSIAMLDLVAAVVFLDTSGYITVSPSLEPGVYATADVQSGLTFGHVLYDDFRLRDYDLLYPPRAETHSHRSHCYVNCLRQHLAQARWSSRARCLHALPCQQYWS